MNELAGLSSGSVPCAVVWSLVMRELIQGLNFEWSWTYEHIRTGVCFGQNVLGGGRWFIHAGQGINEGGDHRSRKH